MKPYYISTSFSIIDIICPLPYRQKGIAKQAYLWHLLRALFGGVKAMPTDSERLDPTMGVSGFNNVAWGGFGTQIAIESAALYSGLLEEYILLEGVKATHKTQWLDVPNRHGRARYPVGDELSAALDTFEPSVAGAHVEDRILRVAQVVLDNASLGDPDYLRAFIAKIFSRAASWISGLQLDQYPGDLNPVLIPVLQQIVAEHNTGIIFQCHSEILNALPPKILVQKLGAFARAGAVQRVLLDQSEGHGLKVNLETILPHLEAIYASDDLAAVGVSVAGGFDEVTVEEVMPELLQRFPRLGLDAENNLRLGVDGPGTMSYIDRTLAQRYIEAFAQVVRSAKNS